jgi:hypothetical protein
VIGILGFNEGYAMTSCAALLPAYFGGMQIADVDKSKVYDVPAAIVCPDDGKSSAQPLRRVLSGTAFDIGCINTSPRSSNPPLCLRPSCCNRTSREGVPENEAPVARSFAPQSLDRPRSGFLSSLPAHLELTRAITTDGGNDCSSLSCKERS